MECVHHTTIDRRVPFPEVDDTRILLANSVRVRPEIRNSLLSKTRCDDAALPVVVQKGAPLQFREWYPGAIVVKGVFDLPMPSETPVVRPKALFIPPVGFDAQGYRLGYGGGYFDRTLAALTPHPLKIGVAFDLSRIPTIRPQPHDVPMDFIVTESGIYQVVSNRLLQVSPRHAEDSASTVLSERAAAPQAARPSPASS